jgi:hypothetical protein
MDFRENVECPVCGGIRPRCGEHPNDDPGMVCTPPENVDAPRKPTSGGVVVNDEHCYACGAPFSWTEYDDLNRPVKWHRLWDVTRRGRRCADLGACRNRINQPTNQINQPTNQQGDQPS